MPDLNTKDRAQVRKFLNLLTSDQDGEVLAAARQIVRVLKKYDLSPSDILDQGRPDFAGWSTGTKYPHQAPVVMPVLEPAELANELLLRDEPWSKWDLTFLRSLKNWNKSASPRQSQILRGMEARGAKWRG